jgi:hypothetical protein
LRGGALPARFARRPAPPPAVPILWIPTNEKGRPLDSQLDPDEIGCEAGFAAHIDIIDYIRLWQKWQGVRRAGGWDELGGLMSKGLGLRGYRSCFGAKNGLGDTIA